MNRLSSGLLAALFGGTLVAALAPLNLWPLSFVSAAGLFWLLESHPEFCREIGWAFGIGKYGFGASWVYVSINVYGNAPPPLAAFLVLLMVLILSFFVWLQCRAYVHLRRGGWVSCALLFAACWVLGEWLMTWMLSGFPWLYAGYAHLDSPLLGYAPVGGVLLVSLASTACAALGVAAWKERSIAAACSVVALVIAGWLLSLVSWTEPVAVKRAALVQGNTPQATKWQRDQVSRIIRNHLDLTEDHFDADLVVWPEGAITVAERDAGPLLESIDRRARSTGTAFVTGLPVIERGAQEGARWQYYNGAVALGTGQGRYVKQHLVPFGEYVPFESILRGSIEFFDLPMSSMSEGPDGQTNLHLGGYDGALVICYEIAFPNLVRRQAANAQVLLTISNDTWFGRSIGPAQHMQISRMRAVELGRWLLRGTNNGITAIVDHRGEIQARLPQFEAGVLRGEFALRVGDTPFQVAGHMLVLVLVIGFLTVYGWRSA